MKQTLYACNLVVSCGHGSEAAGVIRTDVQKGSIKSPSLAPGRGRLGRRCRAKGETRMESKGYVMQDADVVEFRFNV
ncbi:hypothetical protein/obg-like ATPase 1 [Streptomyces yunnanensis]|uniref:YchF C-terminal domain-containing protein n=1 Tax=Streptomyces yunnanensis TaxID=156453 RepID=A0A9X8R018_9ACTN|nr:hypothetical protein/obg-like ATPase 1 [Streptomyces yunnanensis]